MRKIGGWLFFKVGLKHLIGPWLLSLLLLFLTPHVVIAVPLADKLKFSLLSAIVIHVVRRMIWPIHDGGFINSFAASMRDAAIGLRPKLNWFFRACLPAIFPFLLLVAFVGGIAAGLWWFFLPYDHKELLSRPAFGSFAQAAVGLFGGGIALGTFLINYRQKQRHFERQELENKFKDIQDRFADKDSTLMRANAATRLAEIARTRLPGKPALMRPDCYPFFELAVSELATALYLEEDAGVVSAVYTALGTLTDFDKGIEERLHAVLLDQLAHANRTVLLRTMKSAAIALHASKARGWRPFIRALQTSGRFIESRSENWRLLREIGKDRALRQRLEYAELREPADLAKSLEDLDDACRRLQTVRDILALALYKRIDLPYSPSGVRDNPRLSFYDVFLAGSNLTGANLWGIDFYRCQLLGARFVSADLRGAMFTESLLTGIDFSYARMACAEFSETDLRGADMRGAHAIGTKFRDVNLRSTKLSGAEMQHRAFYYAYETSFSGSNWRDADWKTGSEVLGRRTRELLEEEYSDGYLQEKPTLFSRLAESLQSYDEDEDRDENGIPLTMSRIAEEDARRADVEPKESPVATVEKPVLSDGDEEER